MKFKPKAQIEDIVNIVGCNYIQTSYGFRITHLQAKFRGKPVDYYIHDVKVIVSLKTGDIAYNYLIGRDKEFCEAYLHGGWVSDENIELAKTKDVAM